MWTNYIKSGDHGSMDYCDRCKRPFCNGGVIYSNGDGSFNCSICEQSFERNGLTYYQGPDDCAGTRLCPDCKYYTDVDNFVKVGRIEYCSSCAARKDCVDV